MHVSYLYNGAILILANTVVCIQLTFLLTKTMCGEVMVEETGHNVSPFACAGCFVDEVVDLVGDAFTVNTKDPTLSRCLEVDRTWLPGVARVMDLLCEVKAVHCQSRSRERRRSRTR